MVSACAVIGRGSQVLYDVMLGVKGFFCMCCDWPRGNHVTAGCEMAVGGSNDAWRRLPKTYAC
jgi:hypothetical protein